MGGGVGVGGRGGCGVGEECREEERYGRYGEEHVPAAPSHRHGWRMEAKLVGLVNGDANDDSELVVLVPVRRRSDVPALAVPESCLSWARVLIGQLPRIAALSLSLLRVTV